MRNLAPMAADSLLQKNVAFAGLRQRPREARLSAIKSTLFKKAGSEQRDYASYFHFLVAFPAIDDAPQRFFFAIINESCKEQQKRYVDQIIFAENVKCQE